MSKVKKITVSNLKAVSNLTADFGGCTAIITGGNNKGKSSFLKSLPDRIRGIKPELILKQGEKEGYAELELTTGERFIWKFDDKKEKLTFFTEKNIPASVTKDLCKVYFPPVFDVDEFLNSAPAKQKATLQKITGIDFSEIDRQYKYAYDERTFANKRVAEEKARLVLVDPDLPAEIEDYSAIETELNGIGVHNLKYDTNLRDLEAKRKSVAENQNKINQLQEEINRLCDINENIEHEIELLEGWGQLEENSRKENGAELSEKIAAIKKTNLEIENNNRAKKQNEMFANFVKEAEAADKEVKRIEAEKLDVIKNASMPEGFGFSDEGITYNGFAFNKEQLSSSSVYIAALKLAAIGLGEVKTLHFDASLLDKNSLQEIEKWANENDLQLLIERPDFEGGEIEYQLLCEPC